MIFYLLLLITPLIYFVKYNSYGYFHPEILLIAGVLILAAVIIRLIEYFSGWYGKIVLRTITLAVCLSFLPGNKTNLAFLLAIFVILLINLFTVEDFSKVVVVMASVLLITIIIFPIETLQHQAITKNFKVGKFNNQLPPVIHLILDEHIGIQGIPDNIGQGPQLKQDLKKFYIDNGFHVYGGAYSHYVQTTNSIPNLLNFTAYPQDNYYYKHLGDIKNIDQNKFFSLMAKKGYKIRVYQANYINYCDPKKYPIASCYTYPGTSVTSIQQLNLPVSSRFWFVLKSYLLWSHAFVITENVYQNYIKPAFAYFNIQLPRWKWFQARTSAILIPSTFQQITHDVLKHPNGTLFFAHILGPHNPYIYDANCQITKPIMNWPINVGPDMFMNNKQTRIKRYLAYENQVRCVTKQVNGFISSLKKAGIYKRAIIIINGDHGSRICVTLPALRYRHQFNQQDFKDCFDALFVVKAPFIKPGYSSQRHSLEWIFANIVNPMTGANIVVQPTAPFIYLLKAGDRSSMVPLLVKDIGKSEARPQGSAQVSEWHSSVLRAPLR